MSVWQERLLNSVEPFGAPKHLWEPLSPVWSHQGHLCPLHLPPPRLHITRKELPIRQAVLENPFFWV